MSGTSSKNSKKIIAIIVLLAVIALGSSGVYAAGQIARSNAIGESEAINFALVDAGVSPDDATVTKTEFDYEHGKFVYEIEFVANGIEYDYTIDSANGNIIEKETEMVKGYSQNAGNNSGTGNGTANAGGTDNGKAGANGNATTQNGNADIIGIEKAKEIALASAGYKEADVVFSKAKLDREDGKVVYDIEFYVYDKAEYDYEIDAATGKILEESFEAWEQEDYAKYSAAEQKQSGQSSQNGQSAGTSSSGASNGSSNSAPAASSSSSSSSAPAASSSSSSSSKPATSSSSSSSSAPAASSSGSSSSKPATSSSSSSNSAPATSSSSSSSSKPATSSSSSSNSSSASTSAPAASTPAPAPAPAAPAEPSTITVDQAISIAYSYAGVSSGSVTLEKAKLDREDGQLIYEVEFYIYGVAEYELEIDAYSGAVLDYDYDEWDDDDWDDD